MKFGYRKERCKCTKIVKDMLTQQQVQQWQQLKREENAELNDRNHRLIQVIRNIVDIAGFEIVGRVTLKHKKSGKVFH